MLWKIKKEKINTECRGWEESEQLHGVGVREKIPRANKGDRRLGHADLKRRASMPLRAPEQCAKVPAAGTKAEGDTKGHGGQMKAEGDRVGIVEGRR